MCLCVDGQRTIYYLFLYNNYYYDYFTAAASILVLNNEYCVCVCVHVCMSVSVDNHQCGTRRPTGGVREHACKPPSPSSCKKNRTAVR